MPIPSCRECAPSRVAFRACLAIIGFSLSGCPATSVYRTADPVPVGQWQLGVGADVGAIADSEQDTRLPTGTLEVSLRRGMLENLDLGLRLYTAGIEMDATWRLAKGSWSWALAPRIGGLRSDESQVSPRAMHLFTGLAVIASRQLGARSSLGMGPFAGYGLYRPETGGHAQGAWIGGFVLWDLRIGKRSHLTPELGAYRVVAGDVPVRGGALRLGASWRWDL